MLPNASSDSLLLPKDQEPLVYLLFFFRILTLTQTGAPKQARAASNTASTSPGWLGGEGRTCSVIRSNPNPSAREKIRALCENTDTQKIDTGTGVA